MEGHRLQAVEVQNLLVAAGIPQVEADILLVGADSHLVGHNLDCMVLKVGLTSLL